MSNLQQNSNPEVEGQLHALAELCCEALQGETSVLITRGELLLKALLMSGYTHKERSTLQTELQTRAKALCQEYTLVRGGELNAITGELQKRFEDLLLWNARRPEEEKHPHEQSPAKPANISAASNA
jgi:hypothetical protein